MKILRIHFKDNGQDFLTWDINPKTGKVVNAAPFQSEIWRKYTVLNLSKLITGENQFCFCKISSSPGSVYSIKHAVEKVETLEIEEEIK